MNLSSFAHEGGNINFKDMNSSKGYGMWKAYMQSKLANIYFTKYLSKLLINENIENVKVCSVDLGTVSTELVHLYAMMYHFKSSIL